MSIQVFNEYEGKKGYFGKSFLIDEDINLNGWKELKSATSKRLDEWVGKPMILFIQHMQMTHPQYDEYFEGLKKQELYRKGTILKAGYEDATGNFFVIFSTDRETFLKIKSGEIKYVSPSIWPVKYADDEWPLTVVDGRPMHLAFVSEPAYGTQAKVVGACNGTGKQCQLELKALKADVDNNVEHIREIKLAQRFARIHNRMAVLQSSVSDGDRKNPDNWFTMNGRKIFIDKGKTKEESAKNFLDKTCLLYTSPSPRDS